MKYTIEMHEVFSTHASAQQAFDYIVDFSHIDQWDHTIISSEKIGDSPVTLGTCFELMFSMGKRRSPISYEITEFSSPSRAILTGSSNRFTAVDTVTINDNNDGCSVTWHAEITFTGLSALVVPFIAKKIKATGAKTIRDLNDVLNAMV